MSDKGSLGQAQGRILHSPGSDWRPKGTVHRRPSTLSTLKRSLPDAKTKSSLSIAARLNAAEVAISNSLADAEIQALVADYGYSPAKLTEGKALVERTLAVALPPRKRLWAISCRPPSGADRGRSRGPGRLSSSG